MKNSAVKHKFGNRTVYDFVLKGLSCYAVALLEKAGLLEELLEDKFLTISDFQRFPNAPLLHSALITLAGSKIVEFSKNGFKITDTGRELAEGISLVTLPFEGYAKLLSKQYQLLESPEAWSENDIDYKSIARASIGFGEENINLEIRAVLEHMQPKGTLCDLGCGSGAKLSEFCKLFNVSGLGIDKDSEVIKQAKKSNRTKRQIEFIHNDIREIKGIWEDVEVVMSNFVIHDLHDTNDCIKFLNSIKKRFPRCRCVIISDIVSYSESCPSIMPGFDYVHGLQGFVPRDLETTLEIFTKSGFDVLGQKLIRDLRNTFVWILKPNAANG